MEKGGLFFVAFLVLEAIALVLWATTGTFPWNFALSGAGFFLVAELCAAGAGSVEESPLGLLPIVGVVIFGFFLVMSIVDLCR